jgi:transcriptional regulator with XRE-family HTH domain
MNARELVAWNVRRLRVNRGISQEALAADANVDRAYMSRIERALGNPTIGILEQIATVLDAELIELFREPAGSDERPRPLGGGRKPIPTPRQGRSKRN